MDGKNNQVRITMTDPVTGNQYDRWYDLAEITGGACTVTTDRFGYKVISLHVDTTPKKEE